MARLFLAVFPPTDVIDRLDGLERPAVDGLPFEAEFQATELWLVSSELHPDGARYNRLSQWPLTAGI